MNMLEMVQAGNVKLISSGISAGKPGLTGMGYRV
jgi:hypothetical protein